MWKSRKYTNDILDDMIEMTIENYGEDNDISQRDFIEHEYFQNPIGKAYIKLAYDDENKMLAGQYIVIPMKIKIFEKEQQVILSLNTLTRESYRGQKIFITLAEEVYKECSNEGCKFCYGAPNPNSHPGFIKRLGFKDIGVMPLYLKIIHPSLLVHQKFNNSLLACLAKPFNFLGMTKKQKITCDIAEINELNINLLDSFWKQIRGKYPIMGVRNAEYIRWRYLNMPRRGYWILAAKEQNRIKGYIVGRITEVSGMRCGMVVDFLVEKGRDDIAIALLMRMQEDCYTKNAVIMGCLMQKHFEEAKWLKKNGFFVCPKFMEPQPFPIIFRKLNNLDDEQGVGNFCNWFFTMGDYDVI